MKTARKIITSMLLTACLLFMTACTTFANKSYTFNVNTGEQIKITLSVKTGYSLSQKDGQFTICDKESNVILTGTFLLEGYTDAYRDVVDADENATVLEDKKTNGISYLYYEYDGLSGMEHNFIVDIDNAKTGILLASLSSEKEASEAFSLLTFEKVK
ncbi:MAG: hypothetical protein ACI4SA_07915 [Lachnospiraceae bacterium]